MVFGQAAPITGYGTTLDLFTPLCDAVARQSGGKPSLAHTTRAAIRTLLRQGKAPVSTVHLYFAAPPEIPEFALDTAIAVFGWGMTSLPTEDWEPGARQDWRVPLARMGRAICLSQATARAVRAAMGEDFPLCVIHPPIPASTRPRPGPPGAQTTATHLHLDQGAMLDSARWPDRQPPCEVFSAEEDAQATGAATASEDVLLHPTPDLPAISHRTSGKPWRKTWRYRMGVTRQHLGGWFDDAVRDLLPPALGDAAERTGRRTVRAARLAYAAARRRAPAKLLSGGPGDAAGAPVAWQTGALDVALSGTIFSACHSIWDRSWSDAVSAFVFAFRDTADATLVIHTHTTDPDWRSGVTAHLQRLLPYCCRIVLLDAILPEATLLRWIDATAFYVCASHAEAFPLPMMRFMARGAPPIAPVHSALAELVDAQTGFVVGSTEEHDFWPNDPREKIRTTSHRLRWPDLHAAYLAAYRCAADPAAYASKTAHAAGRIEALTSRGAATLAEFVGRPNAARAGT